MLVSEEPPKHTLVLYAGSSFFSILVMALYKWDKIWMRIKMSVGIHVFGVYLILSDLCIDLLGLGADITDLYSLLIQVFLFSPCLALNGLWSVGYCLVVI